MHALEARLTSPITFAALIVIAMLAWTVAFSGGAAAANGNNGTVKIHSGTEEPAAATRNQPKVCPDFHMHFFFGDAGQTGTWELYSWPDQALVAGGAYTSGPNGEAVETASAEPGQYKLFWQGDGDDLWKHKVFEVEMCEISGGEG